jgi:hypothetical protein
VCLNLNVKLRCQKVNNSNTNEDVATKFGQQYVRCVRNEEECVCSVCLFHCNILIGVRIIKEIPGLIASWTICIIPQVDRFHTILILDKCNLVCGFSVISPIAYTPHPSLTNHKRHKPILTALRALQIRNLCDNLMPCECLLFSMHLTKLLYLVCCLPPCTVRLCIKVGTEVPEYTVSNSENLNPNLHPH